MRAAGDGNHSSFIQCRNRTMTKAKSETASIWFLLAMFAIPLSLGAAEMFGFLILHRRTDGVGKVACSESATCTGFVSMRAHVRACQTLFLPQQTAMI